MADPAAYPAYLVDGTGGTIKGITAVVWEANLPVVAAYAVGACACGQLPRDRCVRLAVLVRSESAPDRLGLQRSLEARLGVSALSLTWLNDLTFVEALALLDESRLLHCRDEGLLAQWLARTMRFSYGAQALAEAMAWDCPRESAQEDAQDDPATWEEVRELEGAIRGLTLFAGQRQGDMARDLDALAAADSPTSHGMASSESFASTMSRRAPVDPQRGPDARDDEPGWKLFTDHYGFRRARLIPDGALAHFVERTCRALARTAIRVVASEGLAVVRSRRDLFAWLAGKGLIPADRADCLGESVDRWHDLHRLLWQDSDALSAIDVDALLDQAAWFVEALRGLGPSTTTDEGSRSICPSATLDASSDPCVHRVADTLKSIPSIMAAYSLRTGDKRIGVTDETLVVGIFTGGADDPDLDPIASSLAAASGGRRICVHWLDRCPSQELVATLCASVLLFCRDRPALMALLRHRLSTGFALRDLEDSDERTIRERWLLGSTTAESVLLDSALAVCLTGLFEVRRVVAASHPSDPPAQTRPPASGGARARSALLTEGALRHFADRAGRTVEHLAILLIARRKLVSPGHRRRLMQTLVKSGFCTATLGRRLQDWVDRLPVLQYRPDLVDPAALRARAGWMFVGFRDFLVAAEEFWSLHRGPASREPSPPGTVVFGPGSMPPPLLPCEDRVPLPPPRPRRRPPTPPHRKRPPGEDRRRRTPRT